MHWRRFVTCLGLLGQACTPQSSPIHQFTVDDERAIRHVDSAYVAAWLRDDTAAVLQTLTPDVVLMPAGQRPLATPNDIRAFWWPGDGTRTKILAFDRSIDELGGDGDLAWVRGTDTLAFSYTTGQTTQHLGNRSMTLAVWKRQTDGSWRIARMMWGTRVR